MKQPDLGRKIAELRKAKGLTQEELVEKCNINVRTLQRIEAGEVIPRSYTIKAIFSALNYDVYNSSSGYSEWVLAMIPRFSMYRRQFYLYVLDLFNLKTNTMKKLTILSIPIIMVFSVLLLSVVQSKAQSNAEIRLGIEKIIKEQNGMSWFNEGKFDLISHQYHENACMMPDQYATLNDRESIRNYFIQLYNRGMRFTEIKSLSAVISGDIAVERGIWRININSAINVSGTYLTQWRFTNGRWMIENEMTKTDAFVIQDNTP